MLYSDHPAGLEVPLSKKVRLSALHLRGQNGWSHNVSFNPELPITMQGGLTTRLVWGATFWCRVLSDRLSRYISKLISKVRVLSVFLIFMDVVKTPHCYLH